MGLFYLSASKIAAQPNTSLPPNTIDCSAFAKLPGGSWHVGASTTFDIGPFKGLGIRNFDLYDILERKCGRTHA
jgi:hypothetical protein